MSTSVTSVTKHFPSPQDGFTTSLASTVGSGLTTVPLNSVAGYTNGQTVVFIVDPSDATKKQAFTGIVDTSGIQVTSVVWTSGTNQTHTGGATIVDYATATHIAMITKGLIAAGLTQAGGMAAITPTSVVSSGAGTFTGAVSDLGTLLSTYRAGSGFDFIESGIVITADSVGVNKNYSISSGVVWLSGKRLTVAAVSAQTVGASQDRYIDLHDNGDGTAVYVTNEVANNSASQALAAGNLRAGIVVAGATTIVTTGSLNQGQESILLPIVTSTPYAVTDSLGNLICPRDPQRKLLGYRQILATFNAGTNSVTNVTGLSVPCIIPTGRKIKVVVNGNIFMSGTVRRSDVLIRESTTQIQMNTQYPPAASNPVQTITTAIFTTTAGAHTYLASIQCTAGANVSLEAGSTQPAYISVELV